MPAERSDRLYCLTFDYPPMRGGVARYLSELVKASQGKMQVLVPMEHPTDQGQKTDDVRRVRYWWEGWPKWLPLVKRCLELKDGTLFVSHVVPIGTAAWVSRMIGGPPYILLFHGTDLKRLKTPWKRWLLRRICARSESLIVNSQATAHALARLVSGADPLVLTPGVNLALSSVSDGIRVRYGIPPDAKVILTVCRLVARKGTDVMVQAVDKLRASHPDVRLVIVGNGPYAQPLHQLADLLGVNVTWVEDATDDDVKSWYRTADIFCLPSREVPDDVEGFGIVFLEAAAAGLPVIGGKGWGTEEAVVDGVTGFVVAPDVEHVADALRRLLDDSDLRQSLGEAGRNRVERDFKWEDRWVQLEERMTHNEERMTRSEKDIAVVIPCYDHAKELAGTLEALARQTLQPAEVIVVDDGSSDDPQTVVAEFTGRLPIRLHRLPSNQGAPAARNVGAEMTSAPLLIFLDADARLEPRALEILRQTLEQHPEADFAYADFLWGRKLFKGRPWDAEALKRMNWIHTSSLIRRTAWLPFDISLKKFQDWDLWLTMSEHGSRGVWVDQTLFRVVERKAGMSRWLPAFMHRLPWPILGWMPHEIKRYKEAEQVIRRKHGI